MNEFLTYSIISLLSLLMFYFWYQRQGYTSEKKWLLEKLNQHKGEEQQPYVDALNKLNHKSSNLNITIWVGLMLIPASLTIDYIWFQSIPIEQRNSVADTAQGNDTKAPDLASAITQLEQKLAENPNDLEGQMLYGRSMMSMQRYDYAVAAYQKANELAPNNADVLTELAEAVAFRNNTGSFLGEPEQYLKQAITINPNQQKAMWLQGIVYYENLNYIEAENIWTKLLTQIESPNIKTTIINQINQARVAQNKPAINDGSIDLITSMSAVNNGFLVVVDASESIKNMTLKPSARIFIYAKQVNGPPMPIAAAPISQPFNWPMSIRLNDSNSLNPERLLSHFAELSISAKLSLSGSATPQADDIDSETQIISKQTSSIQLTLTE